MTVLHLSASIGNREITELLVMNGTCVNAQTKHNFTPLHLAAQNGHKGIVEYLVQNENILINMPGLVRSDLSYDFIFIHILR